MNINLFEERFNHLSQVLSVGSFDKVNAILNLPPLSVNKVQTYKPHDILNFLNEVKVQQGEVEFTNCQKMLILGFINKNYKRLSVNEGTLEAKPFNAYLERMFNTVATPNYSFKSMDIFWKEMAIARLQFFPLTSGVAEHYAGFGLKQGISKDLLQTIRFLKLVLLGGRKPYYEIHTHTPILKNFNEAGWLESYKEVASTLKKNKEIKGVIRGSWFFDPKVQEVSPRLSYLYQLPADNGAKFFKIGEDFSGNALATSKTRQRLYEEGKYIPMSYLLVWPRDEIIKWFDAQY